jgi:hypothetical protein
MSDPHSINHYESQAQSILMIERNTMEHMISARSSGEQCSLLDKKKPSIFFSLTHALKFAITQGLFRNRSTRVFQVDDRVLEDLGVTRAQFLGAWTIGKDKPTPARYAPSNDGVAR